MWDVIVVGSGPAGAAAAIAARRVLPRGRVGLVDRAEFPRDKTCGDGVAPHALDVLARLGVRGLLDDWTPVHRLRLAFPGGPELAGEMLRPTYVVPRAVLDARLRAVALGRGAEPLHHRVRTVSRFDDHVVLDGRLEARVVIGADGAYSAVRAAIGQEPPPGRTAIAVRAYVPLGALAKDEQVIALSPDGSAGYPAYAWAFPIGDGRANVGYGELLPASGGTPTRARLLGRLHELLPDVDEPGPFRGHHLPLSTAGTRQPDGRVLLVGDALSLVNPLTGEGIHAAVLSGALAGIAAARAVRGTVADPGRDYRTALRGAYGRHTRHVDLLARLARPRAVAAGLRGVGSRRRVFDDLVDLGLADGPVTASVLGTIGREMASKAVRSVTGRSR
ncbi:MAG: geranylgeranyl reductase family protein [Actinomycetota bacterium]|nr:geranylgeranyl reductase family protein [Actinomycetota bacterium]